MIQNFVQENDKLKAQSARTPITHGPVECSNRTWKEDTRVIIMNKANKDLGQHHLILYHF